MATNLWQYRPHAHSEKALFKQHGVWLFCIKNKIQYSVMLDLQVKPWGALECQGGHQAHQKIQVIRVVFQHQAMYARTSFRGAKMCKTGKKGVFLVI